MAFSYSAFLNDLSPAWANLNTDADIFNDQYPDALAEDTSWSGFPIYDPAPFPARDTLPTKRRNDAVDDPQPTKRRQFEGIYTLYYSTYLMSWFSYQVNLLFEAISLCHIRKVASSCCSSLVVSDTLGYSKLANKPLL